MAQDHDSRYKMLFSSPRLVKELLESFVQEALEEMIEPVVDSRYLPRFRYFKLAENEVSQDNLDALDNLVSVLFQVETLDPDEVGRKASALIEKLRGEDKRDNLTFAQWLAHYYGRKNHPLKEVMDPLKEVQGMLETKLKRKEEEWEKKYRQEEKVEMARRMRSKGVSLSDIALFTGLTEEEVRRL